jgi:hypothetical protein
MPTELILTTRMVPVRHPEKPASIVRPISELPPTAASPEAEPAPFDRRPTAPIPRAAAAAAAIEAAKEEAAELIELVDDREAALLEAELAQTVVPVRSRQRTSAPPPPVPVTAVARYAIEINDPLPKRSAQPTGRHAAAHPDSGEYATGYAPAERRSEPPPPPRHFVAYGPAPMHRAEATGGYAPAALRHAVDTHAYDEQPARHAAANVAYAAPMHRAEATGGYAPAALRHAVDTHAYDEQPARHAAANVAYAAPMHRAEATGGYAPATVHHADVAPLHHPAADGGYQPTPPRRASSTQWRAPNLAETEPDGHYAPRRDDDLTQVRRQLAAALESARKHEQRAKEAELRACWAERYVPQQQDPEQEQRTHQRHKRMRWIKRVLEVSCVGLALGGYISLLVPVRERVIAQDAMIHQLTTLQQQLRDEKRALLQRIEEMQGSEATTPP